ncbi:Phosphatidylinositol 4,5-bisphosphate-binding protein SLM1 [Cytospora mali]|uniref:Phosphatidylinositol 4,5-bisphosphate-binding protein SLM1 n=1 Tax=Cytospora mali TaxID=578113 RepID=A0A194V638_CYTMA|nr:Phosphatidylinositol 4,5-bisphosphate-binding protein SLM1 [Valsa mali var. pyri (nom. inval.)]
MAAKTPHPRTYSPSSLGTSAVNGNGNGNGNANANGNAIAYDPYSSSNNFHHQPFSHDHDTSFPPSSSPSSTPIQHHQQYYDNGFYPQSQNQPRQVPDHGHEYGQDQTLSNTLANSQTNHLHAPAPTRPGTNGRFTEEWNASQRGSSIINGLAGRQGTANTDMSGLQRSHSAAGSTTSGVGGMDGHSSVQVSRSNTLKKKASLRKSGSIKRSGSRRSMKAGSVRSLALQSNTDEDEMHSAFYCPVPTTGNPTDTLANRFQAWRKVLKDIITYFKEIQTNYEQRSKSLVKLANVLNNVNMPPGFLPSGGLDDAVQILRNYNSQAISEANKAREIEEDVILALTGLRSDLQLKIKEIKNLSGDFKNSVDKEMDATRKAVTNLQETLGKSDLDTAMTTGKEDPYLLRLAVDRQLERQLDEENYLHQAYLNLENSGRELESIVVGEIQKSYNAYAGILKRESDAAYHAIDELRVGPIAMPKDYEWASFVKQDDQFVDPNIAIRSPQYIHYPGKGHYACQEIRAGLLERKTKYLKSYTAGWYVLSPTHLHEFKSADKNQSPVMSLYLPEQKLGSRSQEGGSSPKFILKGRQTGGVHRGHSWVFRAESFDTMMAWYEDIKALTEKTPQERNEFVRGHSGSVSRSSSRRSVSSDGVVDEDDEEPYSAHNSAAALGQPGTGTAYQQDVPRRPSPGGRFPSDIQVNAQRGLQAPLSPSSISSQGFDDRHQQPRNDNVIIAAAEALPGSSFEHHYPANSEPRQEPLYGYGSTPQAPMEQTHARAAEASQEAQEDGINPYTNQPIQSQGNVATAYANHPATIIARRAQNNPTAGDNPGHRRLSSHEANWLAGGPVEAAAGERTPGVSNTAVYLDGTQNNDRAFSHGQQYHGLDEFPRAAIDPTPMAQTNGQTMNWKRPAVSERTESTATLSSEAPTISHLHIPGEYPRAPANEAV